MLRRILIATSAVSMAIMASPSSAAELESIGLSFGTLSNPFYIALAAGIEAEAKAINPNVSITTVGYEWDLATQSSQIDSFIAAGVDIILTNPGDPFAVAPAIQRAQAAGIPVIAVDNGAEAADAIIMTDNVAAGEIACQYIVDKLGGNGNVIIQNSAQVSAIIDRVNGCKSVFAANPGITILSDDQSGGGSREGGMEIAQGYFTRFPEIDASFVVNDPQAIGTNLAAVQQQRSGIIITSVDGSPDIVEALKDPNSPMIEASASQDPYYIGQRGMQGGYAILGGTAPTAKTELIAPKLVTRDNVGEYKGWTGQ